MFPRTKSAYNIYIQRELIYRAIRVRSSFERDCRERLTTSSRNCRILQRSDEAGSYEKCWRFSRARTTKWVKDDRRIDWNDVERERNVIRIVSIFVGTRVISDEKFDLIHHGYT